MHSLVRVYDAHTGNLKRIETARGRIVAQAYDGGVVMVPVSKRKRGPCRDIGPVPGIPMHTAPAHVLPDGTLTLLKVPVVAHVAPSALPIPEPARTEPVEEDEYA